jgi:heptosyltransferase II
LNGERIWVRLPNWLGDALMARPLLHGLRRARPGAEIRVAGPRGIVELLHPERVFDSGAAWPADARGRAELLAGLRQWRAGAAIVTPPSFSSAWFAFRSGAPERVGFATEGRGLLLTRAVPRPPRGDVHLSEEYVSLGSAFGIATHTPEDLVIPDQAKRELDVLLAGIGVTGAPFVLCAPAAAYGPAKRWDALRFAELASRLAKRGVRVLVCGTEAERGVCRGVAEAVGRAAVDLSGRTSLAVLAALAARASVVVCNDSGMSHLAAAVGAPTVALFGSTSSSWTAPLGRRVRVIQHAPVCAPCFQRTCRIGYACLRAIEVSEVEAACIAIAA